MKIPEYILNVLNVLENSGFEGYLVGGCVRDAKMGIEPHDFDLTTNATPDEMLEIFSGYRIIETGLKHGTVTVVSNGENVEITTYRIDGEYLDNRRPDNVTFTRNLKEDLSRRDFTVNAFAYNPKIGFVDMFDGMTDMKNKVIRCVGDPDKRFNEDGLRIMRALRFASCLGFSIDKETSESICANKKLLKNISAERIYTELKKLVCGIKAVDIITQYMDVFSVLSPQINNSKEQIYLNVSLMNQLPNDYMIRIAALFFGVDSCLVKSFMNEMKADNYATDFIVNLSELSELELGYDKVSVRNLMRYWDDELIVALAEIKRVYSKDFDYEQFMSSYNIQKNMNPCVRMKQLEITGNDIMSLGIPKGPMIGKLMDEILSAVIEDECRNDYESIIEYLKKITK